MTPRRRAGNVGAAHSNDSTHARRMATQPLSTAMKSSGSGIGCLDTRLAKTIDYAFEIFGILVRQNLSFVLQ